ncbi:hypothetical protein, partial [Enterococcus faecium]|uniref:hypothetical protein n=1 Tax=Enterococcus faecium TaxID=1352 RepID=UPI003F43D8FE
YLDFCNNAVDRFDPYSPVTKTGGDNVYHFGLLGPTRINALRYAANALASQVLASGSDSRIGAVTWASDVIATLPPSSDPAVVGNFLDRM